MKPASIGARISAAIMDLLFVSFLSYMVTIPIFHFVDLEIVLREAGERAQEGEIPVGFLVGILGLVLLMGFLTHGYYMYFESTSGQTPGKKILGLRVVNMDGGPITRQQALSRELIRWYIDALFLPAALISMATSVRRQRIGDRWAKTQVVQVP